MNCPFRNERCNTETCMIYLDDEEMCVFVKIAYSFMGVNEKLEAIHMEMENK